MDPKTISLMYYWVDDILESKLGRAEQTWALIAADIPDFIMTNLIEEFFTNAPLTPGAYASILDTQKGNVNAPADQDGMTMLTTVLYNPSIESGQALLILLEDPRIDSTSVVAGRTPLEWAIAADNAYGVRALTVLGRYRGVEPTLVEHLKTKTNLTECMQQLRSFALEPELYYHRWSVEMKCSGASGVSIYAGFVLLAEDYATLRHDVSADCKRFYTIGSRLPLDLQAVLAWRTVDRMVDRIPDRALEIAVAEFYGQEKS